MEGVSMYFKPDELTKLLVSFNETFSSVSLLMDCYTKKAAKLSKYKNPINDVGVNLVYGYDDSEDLTDKTGFRFVREHILTPQKYIDMLTGSEKAIFAHLFAGRIAKSIYRMYEFQRDAML